MPIFGAAYAAPNKGTTILSWFRSLSTVISPTENSRIQVIFKAFEWFSSTFQGRFNFQDSPLNSRTFKHVRTLYIITCGRTLLWCTWHIPPSSVRIPFSLVCSHTTLWNIKGVKQFVERLFIYYDTNSQKFSLNGHFVKTSLRLTSQGSHRNSKSQFHHLSMIFHDQQYNYHNYLMHSLQPSLLASSSPRWA